MKTVNLTTLTKGNPLDARQSAKIIIDNRIQDVETGSPFLSQGEMMAIKNNPKKDNREYNRLLELNEEWMRTFVRLELLALHHSHICLSLYHLLLDYFGLVRVRDLLGYFEYLKDYDEDFGRNYDSRMPTILSSLKLFGWMATSWLWIDTTAGDLKNISIEKHKEEIEKGYKKLIVLEKEIREITDAMIKIWTELDVSFYQEKVDHFLPSIQNDKNTVEMLMRWLHESFYIASIRDPLLEAQRKRNLEAYKMLSEAERTDIDEFYPDFKTMLIELDQDLELLELYDKREYSKIADQVVAFKHWYYANISGEMISKYWNGTIHENTVKRLEEWNLDKSPSLFMSNRKLMNHRIKAKSKIKLTIGNRKVGYDWYLNKLIEPIV